jgi:predicted metal-dependent hydrolase
MRLRFDEAGQMLKLTHPRGMRASVALAWAASQKRWVEEQIGRSLPPEPLVPGTRIPVEGTEVRLCWVQTAARTASLVDGAIVCGGDEAGFGRRVELFLRRLALERLSAETASIAGQAGLRPTSVRVGDARSRWGSCSSAGAIRYSWRLILAPPEALKFVVAHEVAHLMHLNHGPEFKALERELFGGDVAAAQRLLRSAGPRLRRIAASR